MADTDLVMRARIVDDATARLQGIATQLKRFSANANVAQTNTQFAALKTTLLGVGTTLRYSVLPQLALIGVGSGGLALAVRAATTQLTNFAKSAHQVREASKEFGFAETSIRSFIGAASFKDIDAATAMRGISTLGTSIKQIRMNLRNEGPLTPLLSEVGGGRELVEKIQQAKDEEEAKQRVIDHISDLHAQGRMLAAKRVSSMLYGSEAFFEVNRKLMAEAGKSVYQPTERALIAARELYEVQKRSALATDNWSNALIVGVLPAYKSIVDKLHEMSGMHNEQSEGMKAIEEASRNIAKIIDGIKREDVDRFLKAGATVATFIHTEIGKAVKDFRDVMGEITKASTAYKKDGVMGVINQYAKPDPLDAFDDEDQSRYGKGRSFMESNIEDHARWLKNNVVPNFARAKQTTDEGWSNAVKKMVDEHVLPDFAKANKEASRGADAVTDAFKKLRQQMDETHREIEQRRLMRSGDTEFGGRLRTGGGGGDDDAVGGGSGGGARRAGRSPMGVKASADMGTSRSRGLRGGSAAVAKTAMMDELRKLGVPEANVDAAASSLAGQAIAESGLNPNTKHDSGTGYGIYGARDPIKGIGRKTKMLNWLKSNGYAPNSLEGQSRYMAREAMLDPNYAPSRRALMGATPENMQNVANTLTKNFEAPKVNNWPARYHAARGVLGVGGAKETKEADPFSTERLDKTIGAGGHMTAKGNVNVNVTAPRGWKSDMESDGMFQDSRLRSITQMPEQPYYNPPPSKGF